MERVTVDLTAEDEVHLGAIVAYFGAGRFGVEISRGQAVRFAVREFAERVRSGQIDNDCGFSEAQGATDAPRAMSNVTPHPGQSVYGILRQMLAVIPRDNARNNRRAGTQRTKPNATAAPQRVVETTRTGGPWGDLRGRPEEDRTAAQGRTQGTPPSAARSPGRHPTREDGTPTHEGVSQAAATASRKETAAPARSSRASRARVDVGRRRSHRPEVPDGVRGDRPEDDREAADAGSRDPPVGTHTVAPDGAPKPQPTPRPPDGPCVGRRDPTQSGRPVGTRPQRTGRRREVARRHERPTGRAGGGEAPQRQVAGSGHSATGRQQ